MTLTRNRGTALAASFLTALALAGCGGGGEGGGGGESVTLQLNFTPGGYHAGLASAVEQGFYEDEGLDVELVPGTGSGPTAQLLASGQADVGWTEPSPNMVLKAQGSPITIIMTQSQTTSTGMTALADSGIEDVSDLAGKSFGVPSGAAGAPLVPLMLDVNDVPRDQVTLTNLPVTSMVPALLQGQVDAILGSEDSYNIQLRDQGEEISFKFLGDVGVPIQGIGMVARDDWLEENGETARKLIAATLKGWAFAAENQEQAIADLRSLFPAVKEEQAAKELEVTPQLFCKNGAVSIGKSEPEAWERSYELQVQAEILPAGLDPTDFYTYDYLPDDLEAC